MIYQIVYCSCCLRCFNKYMNQDPLSSIWHWCSIFISRAQDCGSVVITRCERKKGCTTQSPWYPCASIHRHQGRVFSYLQCSPAKSLISSLSYPLVCWSSSDSCGMRSELGISLSSRSNRRSNQIWWNFCPDRKKSRYGGRWIDQLSYKHWEAES